MSSEVFTDSTSNRGMFDPNLPLQGIFDSDIFDTQEAAASVTHILLPIFFHDTALSTVPFHGTELIVLK